MKNAVSGLGLAPDAAMVTFPMEMFLPGSDLTPGEARKGEFNFGLMHVVGSSVASLDEIAEVLPYAKGKHYFIVKNFINDTSFSRYPVYEETVADKLLTILREEFPCAAARD